MQPRNHAGVGARKPNAIHSLKRLLTCATLFFATLGLLAACSDGNGALGHLELNINGLPDGVNASLTLISEAGAVKTVTEEGSLELEPGNYTVSAEEVTASGNTYRATHVTEPVAISPNHTTLLTIVYSKQATTSEQEAVAGTVSSEDSSVIRGLLWNDHDDNGVFNGGDVVLPHTTVFLDLNNNGVQDDGEPATVTDAVGQYHFAGLEPNRSYQLGEQLSGGGSSLQSLSAAALHVKHHVW